ncbi:hypothetical protein KCP76_20665 [Salmonella enterica subsp. enterica serovar Weltevreden]|nr:hypothetical protein KCP76_20665 [Salmonella enterica subsp. enterica serovar Weltevreden]
MQYRDTAAGIPLLCPVCSSSRPLTRLKYRFAYHFILRRVTHYQSENYFATIPVLKPENFRQVIYIGMTCYFMKRRRCGDAVQLLGLRRGATQCVMLPNRWAFYLSLVAAYAVSLTYDEVELRFRNCWRAGESFHADKILKTTW